MAKLTLADILSGFVSNVVLNDNNTRIEAAIENTLSRDGTGPNFMESTLDMNGNLIINQANPISVEGFNWEGPWQTGILYKVGDVVERNNSSYICIIEHIAGVFNDDLAAGKWQLVASSADLPTQSGNQGKYLTTDGATASWGSVITPFAQTLLDDTNAADARITLGVPSFTSPNFIGEPTAPTPPRFDNSTKLATTAFVQNEGLHYRVASLNNQINTNVNMSPSEFGDWWSVNLPGITVNLPELTAPLQPGLTYTFVAKEDFTLKAFGSQTITTTLITANALTIYKGSSVIVTCDYPDSNNWYITSAAIDPFVFRSTLATTGHLELPRGLLLNWGVSITPATNGAPAVVTFEKSYVAPPFVVLGSFGPVTPTNDITTPLILETYNAFTATFRSHNGSDNGFCWIALGI